MLRSHLAAAYRSLQRSPLHTVLLLAGLALGLAPALLIGLYVRDELNYEQWLPGWQDIYRTVLHLELGNLQMPPSAGTVPQVAGWLKSEFPQILAIGRMQADTRTLRHESVTGEERVYWADPEIFEVLRFPVVGGNLATALAAPDSLVLTRRVAHKYFGEDAPLGARLQMDGRSFQVSAVLQDLPAQTHLATEVFASGQSGLSPLPAVGSPLRLNVGFDALTRTYTYLRLRPGSDIALLERRLPRLLEAHVQIPRGPDGKPYAPAPAVEMQPLAGIHFIPAGLHAMKASDSLSLDQAMLAIAALLVLISGCNFINLTTARVARRYTEVGIRKMAGAGYLDLLGQFVGEAMVAVMISMLIALSVAELLAPCLSAFLPHPLRVDWPRQPGLVAQVLALAACLGVLAGLPAAAVLAGGRPAAVLRPAAPGRLSRAGARTSLVILQLSILIGLLVVTGTVYRQLRYATGESLRFDTGQILAIRTDCRNALRDEIRALPGVRAAACTNDVFGVGGGTAGVITRADGSLPVVATIVDVQPGLLELFGLRPLAGRFFSANHPGDAAQAGDTGRLELFGRGGAVVINETASRRLGFATPAEAVSHPAVVRGLSSAPLIVGVAPDARLEGVRHLVQPVFFRVLSPYDHLMVKLERGRVPETLAAIDALWDRLGTGQPIERTFLANDIAALHRDALHQTQLLAGLAAVAVILAALGLLGLAAFMAGRRRKETGIRKALGAQAVDILRRLLWQFTWPVLWASLVAWPVAAWIMHRWLQTFVYHRDLEPGVFAGATGIALLIAWVTVAGHASWLARLKPVAVLRHE